MDQSATRNFEEGPGDAPCPGQARPRVESGVWQLTHIQAVWLMVAVAAMWSIAGLVSRQLTQARSFEVTFWRSAFTAASLLLMLSLWEGGRILRRIPWRSPSFWLSGLCWGVMFTAFMVALTLTLVANVLVTMALGPLVTALAARLFIGQRLPRRTWAAIAFAGVGMTWMYGAQLDSGDGATTTGLLVALCVPLAGAVQWTLVQRTHTMGVPVDLVPAVLVGAVLSALATLPLAQPFTATGADIAWLALLGGVQLAIPCVLAVVCARVLKAPEVALLALLEVIFGIALVSLGADEAPGPSVLAGGGLVLGALVVNEWLQWRQSDV